MAYSCPRCGIADEHAYLRCYRADCTDGRDTFGRTEASLTRMTAASEPSDQASRESGGGTAMTMSVMTGVGVAVIAHLGMTAEFGAFALVGWTMLAVPLVSAATYRTYERTFRSVPRVEPHRCGGERRCGVAGDGCGCNKDAPDVEGLPV